MAREVTNERTSRRVPILPQRRADKSVSVDDGQRLDQYSIVLPKNEEIIVFFPYYLQNVLAISALLPEKLRTRSILDVDADLIGCANSLPTSVTVQFMQNFTKHSGRKLKYL